MLSNSSKWPKGKTRTSDNGEGKIRAEVIVEVQFHDLDPMEIVWHGNYPKYFEVARTELFCQLGYDIPDMRDSGYMWPIVDLQIKYIRPAVYLQKLIVSAELVEWENRIKVKYEIRDAETGDRLTKGHSVQVAVDGDSKELLFVSPEILLEKVERYLNGNG
ncbi:MAG: acyl-CoA thioesterase [Gammaproteobacteria bacterium]|nr:MAG: acyl-CoA thioesterase [Gammaproteobacteria bacterium]